MTAVDQDGVRVLALGRDVVVDALFDGRRIWSFWVRRDTGPARALRRRVDWPRAMRPHLRGTSQVTLREHVSGRTLWDGEIAFGDESRRVTFVDRQGQEISLDKSDRFSPTFSVRTEADLAPLLDAMGDLLDLLGREGVAAFPAYGTLLGAVREGQFLGHDSDADLGYVSAASNPVDVVVESFRLQRAAARAGFDTYRYSGTAFRVRVIESDGTARGLDVFGGFLDHGRLYLMGEVGVDFRDDWIHPLGTTTLAGRSFPAPARPEKLLEAMYGPSWRVPDPAFKFETSAHTQTLLNQWFRGTSTHRREWERRAALRRRRPVPGGASKLARTVARREPAGTHVLDIGAGRGRDALWLAGKGLTTTAYDYVPGQLRRAAETAAERSVPLDVRELNLDEWRSVLSEGARLSRLPGRRAILARHVMDATDDFGRRSLARLGSMALRGGGRMYVETWTGEGAGEDGLVPLPIARVRRVLEAHGARIVSSKEVPPGDRGNTGSVGRVVAQWE
ncbi:MAG: class I SAM-dependent methyltransferase [Actinobacteria bacterium]|uniref:Unannotated protein n=1 Tax=freshwater metagenome TaxID=449393 RepID=A0A6J6P0V7_9ZZZZ|nr:class I SAM-dependent methyltransferase [Actinomycetota bacterium]